MIDAKNPSPCKDKVDQERKSLELQSKVGMTCIVDNQSCKIEKVDSQHFYVRDQQGFLLIKKHDSVNF